MARQVQKLGKQFGYLTATKYLRDDPQYGEEWEFTCDCGNTVNAFWYRRQSFRSCGCHRAVTVLPGTKWGKLTFIQTAYDQGKKIALCECECGSACQFPFAKVSDQKVTQCPQCTLKMRDTRKYKRIAKALAILQGEGFNVRLEDLKPKK